MSPPWTITRGDGPIIATAVHAGHDVSPDTAGMLAISDEVRLREEDPFTDAWVRVADSTVVAHTSRFELDLNRPRDKAVYQRPEDAWGLTVWSQGPPAEVVAENQQLWDRFYAEIEQLCAETIAAHGGFVVLDLHSYNHRRGGPDAELDDPAGNPDINVGTASVTHHRWRPLIDRFIADLSSAPLPTGALDVRENIRFGGGHFPRWLNGRYQDHGCALAIEVKKFFMDEWTGELDHTALEAVGEALAATTHGLRTSLAAG